MEKGKDKTLLQLRITQGTQTRHRVLKGGQTLTVGQSPENDITLFGENYPKKHALLVKKSKHCQIHLQEYMGGAMWLGNSRLAFEDLIKHRLLPRKGDSFVIQVSAGTEGFIDLGEVRIDFSYNGTQAAPQEYTDYSWRRAFIKSLGRDLVFKFVFVFLLTIHAGLLGFYHGKEIQPEAKPIELEKIPERFARFILKPPSEPVIKSTGEVVAQGEASKAETAKTEDKTAAERSEGNAEGNPTNPVAGEGLLGLISGVGASKASSSVVDFLVDKGLVKELDNVFSETNLKVGNGGSSSGDKFDQLIAFSERGGIDKLVSGYEQVETVTLKKQGQVNIESPANLRETEGATGQRSEESIRSMILSNMGRITYIYNKYLKRDPNLRGKLVLEIAIAASGEITNCYVVEETVNNPDFVNEILSAVRRWKFAAIARGTVTVNYPFVFYKAEG